MRQALSLEARQLLGADLVIASDRKPEPAWTTEAERRGLTVAQTVNFPSMVMAGGRPQLASIKAVSASYPLRGRLRVSADPRGADEPATQPLARGTLWRDAQLLQGLGVALGARAVLGDRVHARADHAVEPDRGASFINFAPAPLIRLEDLEATGQVQPASRVPGGCWPVNRRRSRASKTLKTRLPRSCGWNLGGGVGTALHAGPRPAFPGAVAAHHADRGGGDRAGGQAIRAAPPRWLRGAPSASASATCRQSCCCSCCGSGQQRWAGRTGGWAVAR
jgi:hypothetical protein